MDGWTDTEEVQIASRAISSIGESSKLRRLVPFISSAGLRHVILGENIEVFENALRR